MRRITHLIALICLLVVSVGPTAAAARPRELTGAERRRLERGRIVRRPLEGNRRLVGGTSWIVIDAPLDTVWQTMRSVAAYRTMFPSVERIRVLESEGRRRLVRIDQEETVGTFTWVVALAFDEGRHEVRFRLDRTHRHVVDDGWGYVRLSAHGDAGNRTLVTFGAVVDPGDDALVQDLLDDRAERRMLGMPRRLKRQIERDRRVRAAAPAAPPAPAAAPPAPPAPAAPGR